MKLTVGQRLICDRVLNVFETGTVNGKYGAISIYTDGPNEIRQITYGRSQTTEYGNLRILVEMYAKASGTYSDQLAPYAPMIGRVALVDNEPLKDLLRRAGREDPVMQTTQDVFFDKVYFQPAQKWAEVNGFTLPLSMLVIYDSHIHSGQIFPWLRSRFSEATPKKGGDEKVWVQQYTDVRNQWLSTHRDSDLVASAYRTRDLLREIKRDNWDFANLPIIANGTPVDDRAPPPQAKLPAFPKSEPDDLVPFLGDIDQANVHLTRSQHISDNRSPPAFVAGATLNRAEVLRGLAQSVGMATPVERMLTYRDKYRSNSDPRYWAAVNFGLHSSKPRLFVFDTVVGEASRHLCAHGQGSDVDHNGFADRFSNVDGSHCTSLGIYHCDLTYISGNNGKSLYLDGLETSNSAARFRHIVMHGADYVSSEYVDNHGKIGRSHGCPAIPLDQVENLIPKLMGGSLLIHWDSRFN